VQKLQDYWKLESLKKTTLLMDFPKIATPKKNGTIKVDYDFLKLNT
jgi:hypothetical protein